ncbi:hypothetical protein HHI36_003867 [Cryptolaemus montrouzieri]|uniref:SET domain-containing protein n=1 Tax=Cryptolaemus montrouzieri TaxID=559131 RepID=A0ABD2NPS6_9CUCU
MNEKRTVSTVSEVINDFLKRKNLIQEESPWALGESTHGGIGVFATRDIESGEEVFKDYPVIIGPRTTPNNPVFCMACYRNTKPVPCLENCGLPICSAKCKEKHKAECELFKKKRGEVTNHINEKLFKFSTPLRSLLLDENDRKVVAYLKYHEGAIHGFEIDKLQKMGMKFEEPEEKYLRRVCCVMDANAFEVIVGNENNYSNLRGLYPLGSLLNHSCVPNMMHVFDKNQLMVARACMKIKKGEELCHSYARAIWGTPTRMYHLVRTKHFICRCPRCCDPKEFGSYMSAFVCKNCNGNVIPKHLFNLKSDWICEDCHVEVKREEVANLMLTLGSVLSSFDGENIEVMLKFLSGKLRKLVTVNHEMVVELKYKIVWIIGHQTQYKWNDIDDNLLNLKKSICEELLDLLRILRLGECKLKGLLLYELYLCLKEGMRRDSLTLS